METTSNAEIEDGFARAYGVQLLFEQTPQVRKADLLAALRHRIGSVEPLDDKADSDLLAFVYPDHSISYGKETVIPAQTLITVAPNGLEMEKAEAALQQTWDWPQARSVVSRCQSVMFVTDFMSGALEYKERLTLFQQAVSAVIDTVSCIGIYWLPSQRFVDPAAYVQSKQPQNSNPLFPALNVRLFNINSVDDRTNKVTGETLMDTMGLAALGVPDLQCHFVGLELNDVAGMLYKSAYYLFDKGDVIADRETIEGVKPGDRWRCQHEMALVGPDRIVLDINPGRPYAAGGRR